MASNHIEIPNGYRLSDEVRQVVNNTRQARDQLSRLINIIEEFNGDYAALAVAFGLTGATAAADAQAVFTILSNAWTNALSLVDVRRLINRLG